MPHLILACGLLFSQDANELVERFQSDDLHVRERAEAELIAKGPTLAAALRARLEDRDPEIRARVARVLREIERIERVRPYGPQDLRLTLALTDEPFSSALQKVIRPFGMLENAVVTHDLDRARSSTVSLRLENATLWQGFDALCAAARARLPGDRMKYTYQWRLVDAEDATPALSTSDAGGVRLFALPEDARRSANELHAPRLRVKAALPPGAFPTSRAMEDVELTDDRGRRLATTPTPDRWRIHRHAGTSTIADAWEPELKPVELEGARTLRLRGTLRLRFPHDFIRHEIDLNQRADQPVGGAVVTGIESTTRQPRGWTVSYSVRAREGGEPGLVIGWIESEDGQVIYDNLRIKAASGPNASSSTSISSGGRQRPRKLVLMEILGEDAVTVPFDLKGIPVPAGKPRDE